MLNSNEILKLINDYLDNIKYEREPKSLYVPIRYVLSLGGKRMRPTLMMMAYNLFKDDPENILQPACALETYHNYTLLHDDLMDNADLRRGHQTVHKKGVAVKPVVSETKGELVIASVGKRGKKADKNDKEYIQLNLKAIKL